MRQRMVDYRLSPATSVGQFEDDTATMRCWLTEELRDFLATRPAGPEDATGSEDSPGVVWNSERGEWEAWDSLPISEIPGRSWEEQITAAVTVTQSDLAWWR